MGTEYYIKTDGKDPHGNDRFLATKFMDGAGTPDAVYVLLLSKGIMSCNCPAGTHRGRCKHVRMVDEFNRAGQPLPYVVTE